MTMRETPVQSVLLGLYDKLSNDIAGGGRIHPDDLLPGAQDPFEGMIPDSFRPDVTSFDWLEPSQWMQEAPDGMPSIDIASIPAPGSGGTDGDGLDFFRSGEAPGNYVNRANPLYKARTEFATTINGQIEKVFGVKGGGVGYYRPPSAEDATPGGRSPNSDHYSAGAIDYYGDPEELDRLAAWARNQPFVSFVRWRSESHHDHLHMSFDLGWVAKNYYVGRSTPTVAQSPSEPLPNRPAPTPTTAPPVPPSGPR